MSAINVTGVRFDVSIPGPGKEIIERAARAAGQTVSEFAATALVEKAGEVLRGPTVRTLSAADARRFIDMLDAPPAPNDALKAAARRSLLSHG